MSTHKNKRRLVAIGALTAASALIIPAAYAADSYPPQGDSAVASAQPVVSGYRVQDLRDWTPESDPFASQLRATVPLQPRIDRNPDTQVKPELDGKSEIMLMQGDYGNSFFGSTTFNNTFTDHTLNFWQYTDYWSPWHGGASLGVPQAIYNPATSDWRNRGFEFGVLTLPSPEYTNAAHRNGVKSIAILYFDPSFRPGLTFTEMFDKDPNSQGYLIAKKLVDMAKYYGFDG
ncbi:MAG: cell wall protein, partial [Actinomyces sp.]|nr:cell wall protein [Actinomyces sp.]